MSTLNEKLREMRNTFQRRDLTIIEQMNALEVIEGIRRQFFVLGFVAGGLFGFGFAIFVCILAGYLSL